MTIGRLKGDKRRAAVTVLWLAALVCLFFATALSAPSAPADSPAAPASSDAPGAPAPANASRLLEQTQADVERKSAGCISCHTATDSASMHESDAVRIG